MVISRPGRDKRGNRSSRCGTSACARSETQHDSDWRSGTIKHGISASDFDPLGPRAGIQTTARFDKTGTEYRLRPFQAAGRQFCPIYKKTPAASFLSSVGESQKRQVYFAPLKSFPSSRPTHSPLRLRFQSPDRDLDWSRSGSFRFTIPQARSLTIYDSSSVCGTPFRKTVHT